MLPDKLVAQAESAFSPPGFQLTEILGIGGMGVVYAACSFRNHHILYAVKMLHPLIAHSQIAVRQFQQEAEIELKLAGTPGIVKTCSFGIHPRSQQAYKIMHKMAGQPLVQWLKSEDNALKRTAVFKKIEEALRHVHLQGIVHGDVKPDNIFIEAESLTITLFDFGLARLLTDTRASLYPSVFKAYSPRYASPAVLAGSLPHIEDDLYSLYKFKI